MRSGEGGFVPVGTCYRAAIVVRAVVGMRLVARIVDGQRRIGELLRSRESAAFHLHGRREKKKTKKEMKQNNEANPSKTQASIWHRPSAVLFRQRAVVFHPIGRDLYSGWPNVSVFS